MTGNIVDDVVNGRRFPYSRAFARAGFSAADAESWRRAGWDDATEAAPWHHIGTDADAATLRSLAAAGFTADDVAQVARFAPHLTAAWTHVLLGSAPGPDLDLRDPSGEEDALRQRVRANLHRENHPIGP